MDVQRKAASTAARDVREMNGKQCAFSKATASDVSPGYVLYIESSRRPHATHPPGTTRRRSPPFSLVYSSSLGASGPAPRHLRPARRRPRRARRGAAGVGASNGAAASSTHCHPAALRLGRSRAVISPALSEGGARCRRSGWRPGTPRGRTSRGGRRVGTGVARRGVAAGVMAGPAERQPPGTFEGEWWSSRFRLARAFAGAPGRVAGGARVERGQGRHRPRRCPRRAVPAMEAGLITGASAFLPEPEAPMAVPGRRRARRRGVEHARPKAPMAPISAATSLGLLLRPGDDPASVPPRFLDAGRCLPSRRNARPRVHVAALASHSAHRRIEPVTLPPAARRAWLHGLHAAALAGGSPSFRRRPRARAVTRRRQRWRAETCGGFPHAPVTSDVDNCATLGDGGGR